MLEKENQWKEWDQFVGDSESSLKSAFNSISKTHSQATTEEKRKVLRFLVVWHQIHHFLLAVQKDLAVLICQTSYGLISLDDSSRTFKPTEPLPKEIPMKKVESWFQRRLFKESLPPVQQVYLELFHWFGFTAKSWQTRDRNLKISFALRFLLELKRRNVFFFGYGVKESEEKLKNTPEGTFMLRLSSSQVLSFTATFRDTKQVSHLRLNMLAGFLFYSIYWPYYPIRNIEALIRDANSSKKPTNQRWNIKNPLKTDTAEPQYCPVYVNNNSNSMYHHI